MWFALVLLALFGVAGLVIDLGLVRTTQRHMQTAADMAALEGARWADDPTLSEEERRERARQAALLAFADDEDPERFGAGPNLDLSGGVPLQDGFNASQLLTIGSPRVYMPDLRLNLDDEVAGDMVRGAFLDGPSIWHGEQSDYSRDDFTPGGEGAFLVRLRRSTESFADSQSQSNGPPIPYLMARGSLLAPKSKGDGVTVRATSIAASRPALSVGPVLADHDVPGVAPFALELSSWQAWRESNPEAVSITLTVSATGLIGGEVTGRFTLRATTPVVLGQPVEPANNLTALSPLDRYVPLFANLEGTNRVVGFLHSPGQNLEGDTFTIQLSKAKATRNASAALGRRLPEGLSASQVRSLFSSNALIRDGLQAPVLVR